MPAAHQPRKRFGQNFLVDPHYIARIVDAVSPRHGETIVEIGPGLAALTRSLIERAGHVTALEIDRDLAARLEEEFPREQLTLVVGDALEFDFSALGRDLRIVGNLPYNISSPLLFQLAGYSDLLRDVHVMLQKEVVARMAARPGTADYGRLTVMLQVRFAITRLFVVPPGAFRPAPKVDSAVARLVPLRSAAPGITDRDLFERVVAASFGQRRKTLRNALRPICDEGRIAAAGIDPGARGETLAVLGFRAARQHARGERLSGRYGDGPRPQSRSGRCTGSSMRTSLRRAVSPRSSATCRSGTPNASARKRSSASLALPSTAGAARRILSESPCTPATSLRRAPGWACTLRISAREGPERSTRHHAASDITARRRGRPVPPRLPAIALAA